MTLIIHTQEDDQRQLNMTIEVPEERVQKALREKVRKLGQQINIPGFRRGKVPPSVVLKYLGAEAVRAEAAEDLVQEMFKEALIQQGVEPYAPGELVNMELEPLKFQFNVPLVPTVDLGHYRGLQKDVEEVEITPEAVDEALEQVRQQHQILEPVERPAQAGDVVTVKGEGRLLAEDEDELGEVVFSEERIDLLLDGTKIYFGQPFVDELVGLSAEETKEFTITLPVDEAEVETEEPTKEGEGAEAGEAAEGAPSTEKKDAAATQQAHFHITILEVKNRILPDLNDDLAREHGEHDTLEELKSSLYNNLHKAAEEQIKNKLVDEMIEDLLAQATIIYPPAAIERILDEMIEDFKGQATRAGWQWDDYLKLQGQSEKSLRTLWYDRAVTQLRHSLVFNQFIADEKLKIKPAEIDALFEQRYGDMEASLKQSLRRYFTESQEGFGLLGSELLLEKASQRVREIRLGTAPDLASLEETEDEDEEE